MSKDKHIKFNVIIGNPPYQEETSEGSKRNGQKSVKNIFQYFQEQTDGIADEYTYLIYPGGRWIQQAGKGMQKFGLNQINDPHLKAVNFFPNASDVFENVRIPDGISTVLKDMSKNTQDFKYIYNRYGKRKAISLNSPGAQILPLDPDDLTLVDKISDFVKKYKLDYLHNYILPRSLFGIESTFVEDNSNMIHPFSNSFDESKYLKLFSNDKAGKAGRAKWFLVDKNAVKKNRQFIDQYQVVVSSASPGGQRYSNQIAIMDNKSVFGRTRLALRSFKTLKEAQNFLKYAESKVIKYTFLLTDDRLSSLAKWVPDILNYSDNSKLINFSQNIDIQLCNLIGISKAEFNYMLNRLKDPGGDK